MRFEWDARQAAANLQKHSVSFEEASTGDGPDHSFGERRFVTFGLSSFGRLLVVAHAERGDAIRIISARQATRADRKLYEEG